MKIKTLGKKEVPEVPWGVYLWRMPDGKYVGDDEGHFLMIESLRGDRNKIDQLRHAAKNCGVDVGEPHFFAGNRIVSDEEYEEQRLRLLFGLTPDKYDVASIEEDRRNARRRR